MIAAHNVEEVESVNDLETSIFTAKAIEMGVVSDQVVRLPHHSAGKDIVIVRVCENDGLDILFGDMHVFNIGQDVGNKFKG
jgi:hypothetical protein